MLCSRERGLTSSELKNKTVYIIKEEKYEKLYSNIIQFVIVIYFPDRPGKKKITLTRFLRNFKTHRRDKSRSQQNVSARVRTNGAILLLAIHAKNMPVVSLHFVFTTVGENCACTHALTHTYTHAQILRMCYVSVCIK